MPHRTSGYDRMMIDNNKFADEAVAAFHRPPERFNCAQAVALAAGESPVRVAELAASGGGRAPGGLCGALHAAMSLLPSGKAEAVRREFARRLGADTCRALKGELKVPCADCVRTAAELVGGVCR